MKPILFPEGQDENGADVVVYLPEKVLHSTSAANYPYQRTKVVDFSSDFQSAPTAEELRAKGEKYIENNDIGTPTVSLDVKRRIVSGKTKGTIQCGGKGTGPGRIFLHYHIRKDECKGSNRTV